VETTECEPSDCSIVWGNWTECFCQEDKWVHERKCLKNCKDQKFQIDSCLDECTLDSNNNCRVSCRNANHQDCQHVFSCTLITILLIIFISIFESFIFCFFCFCRREKKRSERKGSQEIQDLPAEETFLHCNEKVCS